MIIAAKGAVASAQQTLDYQWVMVGVDGSSNATVYTSTSTVADSWTSRTTGLTGSVTLYSVASNRTNLYVAVGSGGKLITSPNGTTWTEQTSSFSTTDIYGVAFANDIWVAVGASNKIATSLDGITWTQRTTGAASGTWYAVGYGNGLWAILDSNGNIRTATDPTSTWTLRTSTLSRGVLNGIYYDPNDAIWVAGAENATTTALASSTDGQTWTARDSTFATVALYSPFVSNSSVIARGGLNVATGDGTSDIESSTNGTNWTNRTPSDTTGQILCGASDNTGLLLFAGSAAMNVQTSTDGTTWTNRGTIANVTNNSVCHSSGTPSIR